MLYSLRAGGKRIRPAMAIMACQACKGDGMKAMPAAAALEMIHTYSLIHDDLPAMDNDDLRRGQPTSHKVFGDGMAILAGDALLTYAFHTLALYVQDAEQVKKLTIELAEAAGAPGMIGGQVADLQSATTPRTLENVDYIHTHKTAVMFRAAARMGGICADADNHQLEWLGDYGLKLGLAFQIADDLFDVNGDETTLGKRVGKDADAGKLTYPEVLGVEESQGKAGDLFVRAIKAAEKFGTDGEVLKQLAEMVRQRNS